MAEKIILVLGPTAVGKTALGIRLAQAFDGEIISGDSQQVYRQLAIGTAKATAQEQAEAPHHLIDVRDVSQTYSVYEFVQDAKRAIADIAQRGKIPIVVGGTGLYVQSLIEGYHLGGAVDQEALLAYRERLEQQTDQALFDLVLEQGLVIKEINRRRAIRALELAKYASEMTNAKPSYEVLLIGLTDERQRLYDRINRRVDKMVSEGLLEEARWLYEHYPEAQVSRAIGYKELFPYFRGEQSLEEAIDKLKQNTRRFAKRQLTWFRNRMAVPFYQVSDSDYDNQIKATVAAFLDRESHQC